MHNYFPLAKTSVIPSGSEAKSRNLRIVVTHKQPFGA